MKATSEPKHPYRSGFCGIGRHGGCRGLYAGTACSCDCHTAQPAAAAPAMTGGCVR